MKYPDIIGSSDKSLEIIAMEKDQVKNWLSILQLKLKLINLQALLKI